MTDRPSAVSSPESADSTSDSSAPAGSAAGKSSATSSVVVSSRSTGPTCGGTETCASSERAPSASTSSAADSPVSPLASPASDYDRPTSGGSGPSLSESFAHYDPASSSWRTFQVCFTGELETFSDEIASGSLPTPTVTSGAQTAENPTPGQTGGTTLLGALRRERFLTPTVTERWATTEIVVTRNGTKRRRCKNGATSSLGLSAQLGGRVNLPWLAWLMGFPMDWTDGVNATATRSSRKLPNG